MFCACVGNSSVSRSLYSLVSTLTDRIQTGGGRVFLAILAGATQTTLPPAAKKMRPSEDLTAVGPGQLFSEGHVVSSVLFENYQCHWYSSTSRHHVASYNTLSPR